MELNTLRSIHSIFLSTHSSNSCEEVKAYSIFQSLIEFQYEYRSFYFFCLLRSVSPQVILTVVPLKNVIALIYYQLGKEVANLVNEFVIVFQMITNSQRMCRLWHSKFLFYLILLSFRFTKL